MVTMQGIPHLWKWVGLAALSVAVYSAGSLAKDEQEPATRLKPALKVLPVEEYVTPAPPSGKSANTSHRTLPNIEFLDPTNPSVHLLQRHDDAMRSLPKDSNGFPDWMKALNDHTIDPRSGLKSGDRMEVLDLDVVMRNTKEMPNVRFPHRSHTLWLACSNCHPEPFKQQAGSSSIAMADIFRGQFCGMCHDRVAFGTLYSCYRCHNVAPQGGKQ